MAGKLHTQSGAIIAQAKRDVTEIVERYARRLLQDSNANINRHTGGPGFALGPGHKERDLAGSGYIATAARNGYEGGKSGMSEGRDFKRGFFATPAAVRTGTNMVSVKVAYAAGRATLMHWGYYDPRAETYMQGTPFLRDAAKPLWPQFLTEMIGAVKALESVQQVVKVEMTADMFDALHPSDQYALMAEAYGLNAIDRDVSALLNQEWTQFVGSYGARELQRQRGGRTGRQRAETTTSILKRQNKAGKWVPIRRSTGRMIETYHWETAFERLTRITDAFRSFRASGGELGGEAHASAESSMADDYVTDFVRRMINSNERSPRG